MESEITLTDWHAAPGGGGWEGRGSDGRRRGVVKGAPSDAGRWCCAQQRLGEAWLRQAAGKEHSVYACVCWRRVSQRARSYEKREKSRQWACVRVCDLQERCKKEQEF